MSPDHAEISRLERLSSPEWETILQQATRQSLTPLLYQRVKTLGIDQNLPTDVLQRLRKAYLHSAARNMKLYHEFGNVLKALQQEGIPVIVLKGAHLAEGVYENIALRPMRDMDILVKKTDLAKSRQILMEAGYSRSDSHFSLDLHWNIDLSIANLNIDVEKVWNRTEKAIIAEVETLALAPEDLLLHLCLHLSFHHLFQLSGLRTLCDVRETISYPREIQWEQVSRSASEWGVRNAIYLTLLLARDMIGAQIPDDVIEEFMPDDFNPNVKAWALGQIIQGMGTKDALSPYFWQLWKPGSFKEKLACLRKLLVPSPEFIMQKYPASSKTAQNYFYYLIRLKNHFSLYFRALWRIVLRDEEMTSLIEQQNRNIVMRKWLSSK